MQQSKYDQMVREFPFLTKILAESSIYARTIGQILVARGNENLLAVTPGARLFEDKKSVRSDYRLFWTVSASGKIKFLPRTWRHMADGKVRECTDDAPRIGAHIAASAEDVDYVVEISQVQVNGDHLPLMVTVHKMIVFNVLDDPHHHIRDSTIW
jgi:hypothetical protein